MFGLTLRKEFQGRRLTGTAIELATSKKTGATQIPASEFLEITYPSADALKTIETAGPDRARPLVLIGARGQGKSHLLGMLYHAFTDASATRDWLKIWADRLGRPKLAELRLREDMHVIGESLHHQRHKHLWDLVFERHPHGSFIKGKWEGMGEERTDVPGYDLLLELFEHTPTALILDEFQTWYDALTNTKQSPRRSWAFNFVQLLSEIAQERPELLVLVVSVRDGGSDAFQQIQRVEHSLVDFKGPTAKQDRQKLLLHRLFENRMQVSDSQIESALAPHVSEYLRIHKVQPSDHAQVQREFVEGWPYAPHLMQLLEDQVLVATQAQETRDLIRILADLFKRHDDSPVITAADFRLDDDRSGIAALIDSVSNQHHSSLREGAQRNLTAVLDAVKNPDSVVPHLAEIVGALWLRSLAVGNVAGAEPGTLQIDITRDKPIDDNGFEVELSTIVKNSFNIHEDGPRLVFREDENPQAKLIASARNDNLFADGSDLEQLGNEVRYVIGGEEGVSSAFRIIVLRSMWLSDPWASVQDNEKPDGWDERLPLLVVPSNPEPLDRKLGPWLRDHLQQRRNAVRFLLPTAGSTDIFRDEELSILSRTVVLARRWGADDPKYRKLAATYERELRSILAKRFDRFAILDTWDYQEPAKCTFHVESHRAEGAKIPGVVDEHIGTNVFIPEDFDGLVLAAADNGESVGKLLGELQEPRPAGARCVPWLGETPMKEHVIRLCARGDIAISLRGTELLQKRPGEDTDAAWTRMRGKLGTGRHLEETLLLRPQAVGQTDRVPEPAPDPDPPDVTSPTPPEGTGGIFTGGSKLVAHASGSTSPVNLLGELESWGIGTGTQVQDMSLKVSSLTGAQLGEVLRALPDGMTYELSLKEEKQ